MILVLVFVLILGGAGILYKQLGQKLAPNLLATQTPQETESTEASTPTTQENESEKILAPDFTVYDLDGNEVHLSDFIGKSVVLNFWASWCNRIQGQPQRQQERHDRQDDCDTLLLRMEPSFLGKAPEE